MINLDKCFISQYYDSACVPEFISEIDQEEKQFQENEGKKLIQEIEEYSKRLEESERKGELIEGVDNTKVRNIIYTATVCGAVLGTFLGYRSYKSKMAEYLIGRMEISERVKGLQQSFLKGFGFTSAEEMKVQMNALAVKSQEVYKNYISGKCSFTEYLNVDNYCQRWLTIRNEFERITESMFHNRNDKPILVCELLSYPFTTMIPGVASLLGFTCAATVLKPKLEHKCRLIKEFENILYIRTLNKIGCLTQELLKNSCSEPEKEKINKVIEKLKNISEEFKESADWHSNKIEKINIEKEESLKKFGTELFKDNPFDLAPSYESKVNYTTECTVKDGVPNYYNRSEVVSTTVWPTK